MVEDHRKYQFQPVIKDKWRRECGFGYFVTLDTVKSQFVEIIGLGEFGSCFFSKVSFETSMVSLISLKGKLEKLTNSKRVRNIVSSLYHKITMHPMQNNASGVYARRLQ